MVKVDDTVNGVMYRLPPYRICLSIEIITLNIIIKL